MRVNTSKLLEAIKPSPIPEPTDVIQFAVRPARTLWSAVTCHRFSQTIRRRPIRESSSHNDPLNAALLGRKVGQAIKAVTNCRNPKTIFLLSSFALR